MYFIRQASKKIQLDSNLVINKHTMYNRNSKFAEFLIKGPKKLSFTYYLFALFDYLYVYPKTNTREDLLGQVIHHFVNNFFLTGQAREADIIAILGRDKQE